MRPADSPYLSVVVPVCDEAESLPELTSRLEHALDGTGHTWELVFVDDGSKDGSFDVLCGLAERGHAINAVALNRNHGKAVALTAGFHEARGEIIVTIDADLQDQPEDIHQLVNRIEQGSDLVCGWRVNRADRRAKVLASRLYNRVTRFMSGVPLHDMNCGLKAFRRGVVDTLELRGELHRYIPVIASWHGFAVDEVQVGHEPRRHGRSKYGRERLLRGFLDLLNVMTLTRYSWRPLHLFGGVGLGITGIGAAITLYLAIGWMLDLWWLSERPLLLIGVVMMVIGLQFVLFGLLAEMVTHRLGEQKKMPVVRRISASPRVPQPADSPPDGGGQ